MNNKKPFTWPWAVLPLFILISAVTARAQPILTPYQPGGWSDKLVVTTSASSTTDTSPLYSTNTIYIDWAVVNDGNADADSTFYVYLYTNSVFMKSWPINGGLQENYYYPITGYNLGRFAPGTYTIELAADATDVFETPPSTYTKTFIVYGSTLPVLYAPTIINPSNSSISQPTSPVFTWSSVSNATSYEIFVATNAADLPVSSNTNATSGGPSVVINASVTTTNYTPVNPLDPGTKYYWEVNARTSFESGPWSTVSSYTSATPPAGLTILPVFDSTITTDPQAVTIESTIRAAIAVYQSDFSDPITVSITFKEMTNGLGESSWSYFTFSYLTFHSALAAAATTPDDATALAHLPVQTNNPVNGSAYVNVKTANAWDLGLRSGTSGENVGTISLNTSIMNLSDAQMNPDNYSLYSTVWHEVDEVLATASALDEVNNGSISATGPVLPEDLFRYDSSGNRNYSTSSSDTSWFSIDGTTDLAQFNQVSSGDYGDWYSYYGGQIPEVQDAFATPGASPNLGVELRVLDVLGYHLVIAVPVPNFVSVKRSGSTINLIWTAASGSSYQVQYTTNLVSTVWSNLGGSITASSSTATNTDTIGPAQHRYYRVELLSTPGAAVQFSRSQVISQPTGWGTNVFNPYQH